uniref:Galectin n=1 Tax=Panagrolaimus davidi TaxID=227884 RepID=A0A914P0W0_9BILA
MKNLVVTTAVLSKTSKTIIEINENLQFDIIPQKCIPNEKNAADYELQIVKLKGDFKLQNVSFHLGDCNFKDENTFLQHSVFIDGKTEHIFSLLTDDVKFDVVVSAVYELKVDEFQMKFLKPFESFHGRIILSDYDNKIFEYTVNKGPKDFVVITVKGDEGVRINGETGDYTFYDSVNCDISHKLSFVFKAKH